MFDGLLPKHKKKRMNRQSLVCRMANQSDKLVKSGVIGSESHVEFQIFHVPTLLLVVVFIYRDIGMNYNRRQR